MEDVKASFLDAVAERTQRTTKALKNVHYVLEAHFQMTKNANPQDTPGKFYAITRKRLEKGRCSAEPYFGCREFPVAFREWNGGDNIPTIDDTKDLGYMFLTMIIQGPILFARYFFMQK